MSDLVGGYICGGLKCEMEIFTLLSILTLNPLGMLMFKKNMPLRGIKFLAI